MSTATRWQRPCVLFIVLCACIWQPSACRNLGVTEEGLLQQTEATTTLSLTHSVRYQQPASLPRHQSRRLERQRNIQRELGSTAAAAIGLDFKDFDWETYLSLNPDLVEQGYTTQRSATVHYRDIGKSEKRLFQLPPIVLRYTAATGLSNQHYCHIAAFSLCAVLGKCSIVLPPAVARSSFQDTFSVFKEFNKVQWSAMPLESLYDTDKIIQEWDHMGFKVWKTPKLQELPSLVEPESAYPSYVDRLDPKLVVRVGDTYLKALEMSALVDLVKSAAAGTAQRYMTDTGSEKAPYVVVDFPVTLFVLKSSSNLPLVSAVAKKISFAPEMHRLADKVLAGMAKHSASFNGAHLRVEADAMDWARSMGGEDVYWAQFLKAMRKAGFERNHQLYVATGLLTYAAGFEKLQSLTANLTAEGLCDQVVYKEQFLSEAELSMLHSEQKGLIDLLVLAKANSFVGFEPSTFSFFLTQYRVLQGLEARSSVLVAGEIIGTNPLFEAAAVVVEDGFLQQKPEFQLDEPSSQSLTSTRHMLWT